MNRVFLIGNVASDVSAAATSTGIPVTTFQLAVNRRHKDSSGSRPTDFLPVVCWRGVAEVCGRHLSKGKKIALYGEIQTRSYDAKDGSKRYVTEIVADEVEFLTPKGDSRPTMEGFTEITDVGLPF